MSFSVFIHSQCCSTMELKATSALLLVCVTIIILTSAEVDAFGCCLKVTASKKISKRMLGSVSRYQMQEKSGVCDIDAVVLFIKSKRICADLDVLNRLKKFKKHRKPKRP